jgi:hypothetical protein
MAQRQAVARRREVLAIVRGWLFESPPRRWRGNWFLPVAAIFAGLVATASAQHQPPLSEAARQNADQQIAALWSIKAGLTKTQQKLDSQFIFAMRQDANGIIHPKVPKLRHGLKFLPDGRIRVEIVGTVTPGLLADIKNAGGTVIGSWPGAKSVLAMMPLAKIETLAAREEITFIRPAPESRRSAVDSEGDTTHSAITARANYGVNGIGIKVGVLSDSIDNGSNALSAAITSGNIDANNTYVIPGQAGTGDGEGLAMCEVVHDLAPGAAIYFATSVTSQAQMASNIIALANAGCRIICDDELYDNESPFQDQVIAQAVNTVANMGVLYLSAAGNSGNRDSDMSSTWEGVFSPGRTVAGYGLELDFAKGQQGTNVVIEDQILNKGYDFRADLCWNDPLGASTNDLDLYMLENSSGAIVYSSQNRQTGTQDPYESLPDPGKLSSGYSLVVTLYSGTTNLVLYLGFGRGALDWVTRGCTRGHNACDATNMITVAATPAHTANGPGNPTGPYPNPFNSADVVEYYSADGPRQMYYNPDGSAITPGNFTGTGGRVYLKPELTAADGVTCTPPGFAPFFGTSCATPHAAAIAALVWSCNPQLNATQVRQILTNSCIDIMTNGYDFDSGWGILMAPLALQHTPPPSPQFVTGSDSYTSGGGFSASLSGVSGTNYTILVSTNLSSWSTLKTVTMTNSVTVFTDSTTGLKRRYYRAEEP